jgi:hypothetical protein
VNLLAKFGRVSLGLLDVMILLTIQNIEILLSLVVCARATRARHVRLMSNSASDNIEISLPLLLVIQLAMRLVSAFEVSLIVEAATGARSMQATRGLDLLTAIFLR